MNDEQKAAAGAAAEALAPGRRDLGEGGPETEECGVTLWGYRCRLAPHPDNSPREHYDTRRRIAFVDLESL